MKKVLFVVLLLLCALESRSQDSNTKQENDSLSYAKKVNWENVTHYNKYKPYYDRQLIKYQMREIDYHIGAISSGALSLGSIIYAGIIDSKKYDSDSKADDINKDRKNKKNLYFAGAAFAGVALICEAIAINYRYKAIKLKANTQGLSINYYFR